MLIHEAVINRIRALLSEGAKLKEGTDKYNQVTSENHLQECIGWMAAANHIVAIVCPDPTSPYRVLFGKSTPEQPGYVANQYVGQLAEILKRLLADLEDGLLTSIADAARAEVLDDFLDQGQQYWAQKKKNESGVVIGVVFEDVLRRISRKHDLPEKGEQLDQLISALAKNGVLTATKAKRARAAATVRTKATHAQWDEFDLDDVKATLDITRELVQAEIDS